MHEDRSWTDLYDEAGAAPRKSRGLRRLPGRSPRTRAVVLAAGVLAIGISPFAVAATGDALREGQRNGTTSRETQIISDVNSTRATTGGYATRQSNLSSNGGGAIYGCRSRAGGSTATPPQNPCVRANNLSTGYAFEFNARSGAIGGLFTVGNGGDDRKPFITNATGVATGLNADRVDGIDGAQITAALGATGTGNANTAKTRWALVNSAGQIEAQSGGFTIAACYPAMPAAATGNCYIDTGENLADNGLGATIALQNQTNQGGATMNGTDDAANQNLEFSGEIAVARCGTDGQVACAPDGTNNANHLVVSPRLSSGQRTANDTRKRFYVTVTANSTGTG